MTTDEFHSKPTQVCWTCKAPLDGRESSHRIEIRKMRGWRLGAIIHRLKTEYAWPTCRTPENVALYSLKAGIDRTTQSLPPSALALGNVDGVK